MNVPPDVSIVIELDNLRLWGAPDGAAARRSTAMTRTPGSRTYAHRLLAESDAANRIAGVVRTLQCSRDERSEFRARQQC